MQWLNNRAASLCVSCSLFCGFTLSSSFTLCFIVWRPTLLTPFGDNAILFLFSLYVHDVFLRFVVLLLVLLVLLYSNPRVDLVAIFFLSFVHSFGAISSAKTVFPLVSL
ncbi:hypothetical protein MAP00_006222 [Monascus purpureus]|nr:hypothetical protein MAP00_006222 [Monascus purpureus]